MVPAYVLAGELAAHQQDLRSGINNYERELRDYVENNQKLIYDFRTDLQLAFTQSSEQESNAAQDTMQDFGQVTIPFTLKNYL